METPTDPKPKRKYVMTPEHRAKVLANLAQARLAPREKVYRKTPKRYAANLNNLGIAAAKRREEREILSAKMEELFPLPEVPMPPLASFAQSPDHPLHRMPPSFFLDPLEEATRLIGKRLRKVHTALRREGRRVMRLLTAALKRSQNGSQPLSAEEAIDLARRLLKCLDGTRVTEEARRLNDKITRLLRKMIEVRYGLGPGDVALEIWLEQMREERRAQAAAARERRAARRAQKMPEAGGAGPPARRGDTAATGAEVRAGAQVGEMGVGPALVAEDGEENDGGGRGQRKEPSRVSVPELPKTLEEFQSLVTRALCLEDEPDVAGALAINFWVRLHMWQPQEQKEGQWLERLFQEGAANPPDSYPDPYQELRDRAGKIPLILKLDKDFLRWMDQLTAGVEKALDVWVSSIPSIERRQASRPVTFPAKPPVKAASDQPARGSEDLSSVA